MTSNAAHTPGRLHVGDIKTAIYDEHRLFRAQTFTESGSLAEKEANARRLVACWNAAHDAGLSTEALEAGVVKRMIEALRDLVPAVAEHIDTHDGAGGYLLARLSDARAVLKEIADFPKQSQEERG